MTKTTVKQFQEDVLEIAGDLVQAFGLAFRVPPEKTQTQTKGAVQELCLYRWMDYRLRHISAQPRIVKKSTKFSGLTIPLAIHTAISDLEDRFKKGYDVNPYLSKTTVNHDVASSRESNRTDGLWADWRIHHFHLTNTPVSIGQRFSARSNWLLFAMVYDDVVAFIDVREHGEADLWTQDDLLKTFIDSWPKQAEPYRIKEMSLEIMPMTPADYKLQRDSCIIVPVEHKGEHYLPLGGGITLARTSNAATEEALTVTRCAREFARRLDLENHPWRLGMKAQGVDDPKFCLALSNQGLCVQEKTSGAWSLLPRPEPGIEGVEHVLHEALLPHWSVAPLLDHLRGKP